MDRSEKSRRFSLVLIKPSHYDDAGYVIQWARSLIPSNTLAVLNSLANDVAARQILGPDVVIDVSITDEMNKRLKISDIVARFRQSGGFGFVGLVGVQSNQFPRAIDIARPLRAAGIPVIIGGFHVSGCLAMLPEMPDDLKVALDLGISFFAGEAENRFDGVIQDAAAGNLKPIYNYLNDLPPLASAPIPFLSKQHLVRTFGGHTSFDAGRGCPYQCSFCTIINVQGRKSRGRSADDIERVLRENWKQGVHRFFITDDNFARHSDWESIFDRIIELRENENIAASLTMQVDTLCHLNPSFIDKAKRAGVKRAFIGLENINPDNLVGAKKRQNKITEYRKMLLAWKRAGVITYGGYILGFPNDTAESIQRDIEIVKKELPLDVLEFFCLTPLPGSEDHQRLYKRGVEMDSDMNAYDTEHVVTAHPRMSRDEWEAIYRRAWAIYYTPEHLETVMRRAAATNTGISRMQSILLMFSSAVSIEGVHPLQCGIGRLKFRHDRRPGLPIEPIWAFYPKYLWEIVSKHVQLLRRWLLLRRITAQVRCAAHADAYTDLALTPVNDEEGDTLELFIHNDSARMEVARIRKLAALTHGAPAASRSGAARTVDLGAAN
jgi:radical SAM superfamily enzyme YgiQ (UPF0313 family)